MSARVTALGGRVILPAIPEIRNGTVAIVADPTGGAVALQKWPL
jgi:predicted enzyme related to lactoylglutathione lyase